MGCAEKIHSVIPAFAGIWERCVDIVYLFRIRYHHGGACTIRHSRPVITSSTPRHHVIHTPSSRHPHTLITSFSHTHHVIPPHPSRHPYTVITSSTHRHHVIHTPSSHHSRTPITSFPRRRESGSGAWMRSPPYIRQSSRAIGPGLSWRKVLYTSPVTCGDDSADASRSRSLAFHCQATYKSASDRSTTEA